MQSIVMERRSVLALALLVLACATVRPSIAQQDADDPLPTFREAEPVDRRAPTYPFASIDSGREGWVKVSYVVGTDGLVSNAMIEDSSGVHEFEGAALAAVEKWRYKPATLDGQPVEQSMVQTIIRFQIEGMEQGASTKFVSAYRRAQAHLTRGELDQAKSEIEGIDARGRLNLYEDSWFWWLKYEYSVATKDSSPEELRTLLTASVDSEGDYLPPDALALAMSQLFNLRVKTQDYTNAVKLLTRLKASRAAKRSQYYPAALQGMEDAVRKIDALAANDSVLKFDGSIGRFDYFVHGLLRRKFSIADVKGRVDSVDVRCEHGYARYDSVTGQYTWSVPASWGTCGAYIRGEPGTTFVLYEHPNGG